MKSVSASVGIVLALIGVGHVCDGRKESTNLPTPRISNASAYTEAASMLFGAMDPNFDPCNQFYEYSCNRYKNVLDVMTAHQEVVLDIMVQAVRNISEDQPLPIRQYKAWNEACVRSKKTPEHDFDPKRAVRIAGEFAETTKFPFPLIQSGARVRWPDASLLARAIGYLSSTNLVQPLLLDDVKHDYSGKAPWLLFVGPAVPSVLERKPRFYKLQPAGGDIAKTLQTFAKLVGRYIPSDQLHAVADDITRFAEALNGEIDKFDDSDFAAAHNVFTLSEADSTFGNFFNFTEYLRFLSERTSKKTAKHVTSPDFTFSITSPSYLYKLASLLSDGNPQGFRPETVYNYVHFSLLEKMKHFFVKPENKLQKEYKRDDETLRECLAAKTLIPNGFRLPIGAASDRVFLDAAVPTDEGRERLLASVEELMSGIQDAFQSMISQLTWMTEKTKQHAYLKLRKMVKNIGWPKFVTDDKQLTDYYASLSFDSTDGVFSLMDDELKRFSRTLQFEKLAESRVFDRSEWFSSTATANAFYAPRANALVIPLATLQSPLYDPEWPKSVTYGFMGAILGHELTHGFDDTGIKFDSEGRPLKWMDDESRAGFDKMATCIVDQYDRFCPPFGNATCPLGPFGSVTEGENIADNGGLRAAFRAYRNVVEVNGPDARLPGKLMSQYDHDQVFFLSFAYSWCQAAQVASVMSATDDHSPAKYRVEGPLQDTAAFQAAFDCPVNSTYAPKRRCDIWISKR